ncbi:MAG: SDR family oxidoreductase [Deltaproteobacteria bacterium]|nr:MAG: SDR family oxidoreductase [Deltaproteobacteria bacterium]
MRGKRVLVTGATNGIGLEAARSLAKQGAKLVLVGRDAAKTARCLADVRASAPGADVSSLLCDFSRQKEARRLAEEVLRRFDRLDVLVNNAGTVFKNRTLTEDGIEATFAVNHLGYFLLTQLLLERIIRSAPARIVNVASIAHRRATMDFDDLFYERGYSLVKAYGRSKLGNVLYTRLLAQKLAGTGVTVNSLHPGAVDTGIWSAAPAWMKPLIAILRRFAFISAEEGGRRIVQLVAGPELSGTTGQYFENGRIVDPAPRARDDALARRLWQESERLTGLKPGAQETDAAKPAAAGTL